MPPRRTCTRPSISSLTSSTARSRSTRKSAPTTTRRTGDARPAPERNRTALAPRRRVAEHTPVRIVILSGLSGSGKSVALHMLEDLGFYCIDNIPAALLKPFISYTVRSPERTYERTAIGLDARTAAAEIATVPQLIDELRRSGIQCEVIFLVTSDDELLRRFAETRRKHPMSGHNIDLRQAMALERQLLEPIVYAADLVIDTSKMGVHAL